MIKDTGDEVDVSVKATNDVFTVEDKNKLKDYVAKKLIPMVDDALYFRVKYKEKVGKLKANTESIKAVNIAQLDTAINNIFKKHGVSD